MAKARLKRRPKLKREQIKLPLEAKEARANHAAELAVMIARQETINVLTGIAGTFTPRNQTVEAARRVEEIISLRHDMLVWCCNTGNDRHTTDMAYRVRITTVMISVLPTSCWDLKFFDDPRGPTAQIEFLGWGHTNAQSIMLW